MEKIKVAITDNHPMIRHGLRATIRPFKQYEVVLEAENGDQLLREYAAVKPDIFFMDISMEGTNGIETTIRLMREYPQAKVLAFSMHNDEDHIAMMFNAGARGYLLKDDDSTDVMQAMADVVEGKYYFRGKVSVLLYKKLHESNHPALDIVFDDTLTLNATEIRILQLICEEHTNGEIGDVLSLSAKTVENYRNKLLFKIKARNTAGLVTFAIRKGHFVLK